MQSRPDASRGSESILSTAQEVDTRPEGFIFSMPPSIQRMRLAEKEARKHQFTTQELLDVLRETRADERRKLFAYMAACETCGRVHKERPNRGFNTITFAAPEDWPNPGHTYRPQYLRSLSLKHIPELFQQYEEENHIA